MKRLSIAYLVKRYPRLSETFILNEILEMERQGADITILSLRRPAESRFHEKLARVKAGVIYAPEIRSTKWMDFLKQHLPQVAGRESIVSDHFWGALRSGDDEGIAALAAAVAFLPVIEQRGIRHVHAHFATSATATARCLADLAGIGYSFTAHAKDIFHESVDPGRLVERINDAAFTVAVSDLSADHLRNLAGRRNGARVHRIYNGLDLEEFPAPGPAAHRDTPLIASVGRLVPKKGFPTLLEAAARLRDQGVAFRCEIAGDGEMKGEIEQRIESLRLGDRVVLRGALSHGDVRGLLGAADIFALPARIAADGNRDGLPVVLVEAMAFGVPVVSTPVVGIPEAVEDGVTGLLVPEQDPAALAGAIRRLLDDRGAALKLGAEARRRVEQRFDGRKNVAELRAHFEHAAASRTADRSAAPVLEPGGVGS